MVNNNKLKQYNETQLQYVKRLTENRKYYDLSYSEWATLICGKTYDEHNARKAFYVISAMLEEVDVEIESQITDNEMLQKIDEAKRELYKERVRLQDERRYVNGIARAESRYEQFKEELFFEIKKLNEVKPLEVNKNFITTRERETTIASLILSDLHIGMKNNSFANVYNLDIAAKRLELLHNKVINKCLLHNVETLNIEICGDLIDGALRASSRILQDVHVIKQVTYCSEILADFINQLSNSIPNIVVHCAVGNHSRVSADLKQHIHSENFEYLILEMIKLRTRGIENISYNENILDEEIAIYEVYGRVIASAHGHKEKSKFNSVQNLSSYLKVKIDETHLGHFHQFAVQNGVVVNGAFSGVGHYAQDLRFSTDPSQTLIVYDNSVEKCIYDINLKQI